MCTQLVHTGRWVGGQTVPMGNVPLQGATNINEGNLGYSCSGNSATLIAARPGSPGS
jgi:hypothetical protein